MIKNIKNLVIILALGVGFGSAVLLPTTSFAACSSASGCIDDGLKATGGTGTKTDVNDIIKTVVNVLLFIIGAVAVIMIIVGGIRYTISQGDQSQISAAKNTILYAVIGLIVAICAYAIVNFVVTKFM